MMRRMLSLLLFCIIFIASGCRSNEDISNKKNPENTAFQIPRLERQGSAARLVVNGKPMLLISGELHNSTCGGLEYMRPVWKRMAGKNLNSVIATVSWELVEPEKGKFDFTLVDSIISGAREANLKLVLIWFGSWKNGGSIYIPSWVKKDPQKYPRVRDENGKPLEILSTFGEASCEADAQAFAMLMRHIRTVDEKYGTVVMMQVENEMGILDNMGETPGNARRDFTDAADSAYKGPVPEELMNYLNRHRDSLFPELLSVWEKNGFKSAGTWEEVFGKGVLKPEVRDWKFYSYYTEELFAAWNYARYVEKIASAGKKEYPLPMYVNAWLKQSTTRWPGRYPSGGPLPQVIDIWRAGAPSIDFIAPDIYIDDFKWVCDEFTRSGNPLFIPETRGGETGAARAFFAFGEYGAGCFAPFGIDNPGFMKDDPLDAAYSVLNNMSSEILKHQGKGTMRGVLVDEKTGEQQVSLGGYRIKVSHAGHPSVKVAGGIIINTGPDEFLVAGKNLDIFFFPENGSGRIAIDVVDEGVFINNEWTPSRRLNGDETHASTWSGTGMKFPHNEYTLQKISLYHYR
ncbi:MAG: DUF5597 domain-containing protein [Bacteroidales bacterium]|nr:DUF5597 domain-containing protein [Bacteroidales bacterium]